MHFYLDNVGVRVHQEAEVIPVRERLSPPLLAPLVLAAAAAAGVLLVLHRRAHDVDAQQRDLVVLVVPVDVVLPQHELDESALVVRRSPDLHRLQLSSLEVSLLVVVQLDFSQEEELRPLQVRGRLSAIPTAAAASTARAPSAADVADVDLDRAGDHGVVDEELDPLHAGARFQLEHQVLKHAVVFLNV